MKRLLVYFLILFFTALIIYQVFNAASMLEGFDTNDSSDGSATSQNCGAAEVSKITYQNAADIKILNKQMDDLKGAKEQVTKNANDIATLQTQVNNLAQAQTAPIKKITEPTPTITGV